MPLTKDQIVERCHLTTEDPVKFDRVLNMTADGEVVEASDPRGEYRLVGEGGSLPALLVKELGLLPTLKAHQNQKDAEEDAEAEAERLKAEQDAEAAAAKQAEAANAAALRANTEAMKATKPNK